MQELFFGFLGYLLIFIHTIIFIIELIGPYVINNFFYLTIILFFYVFTYFNWYVYGECVFSRFEQYLTGNNKIEDGKRKSIIIEYIEYMIPNKDAVNYAVTIVPIINAIVILWKINKFYYSKSKFNYNL